MKKFTKARKGSPKTYQNNAEIRTTHITGLVTDLGIEIGKTLYFNRLPGEKKVLANRRKLRLHLTLVTSFFMGGLVGAVGFVSRSMQTSADHTGH